MPLAVPAGYGDSDLPPDHQGPHFITSAMSNIPNFQQNMLYVHSTFLYQMHLFAYLLHAQKSLCHALQTL